MVGKHERRKSVDELVTRRFLARTNDGSVVMRTAAA